MNKKAMAAIMQGIGFVVFFYGFFMWFTFDRIYGVFMLFGIVLFFYGSIKFRKKS